MAAQQAWPAADVLHDLYHYAMASSLPEGIDTGMAAGLFSSLDTDKPVVFEGRHATATANASCTGKDTANVAGQHMPATHTPAHACAATRAHHAKKYAGSQRNVCQPQPNALHAHLDGVGVTTDTSLAIADAVNTMTPTVTKAATKGITQAPFAPNMTADGKKIKRPLNSFMVSQAFEKTIHCSLPRMRVCAHQLVSTMGYGTPGWLCGETLTCDFCSGFHFAFLATVVCERTA